MSGKAKRGSRRERLKRALEEQKKLEGEFKQLQQAQDPLEACQQMIVYVEKQEMDPMLDEANPFKLQTGGGCICAIM